MGLRISVYRTKNHWPSDDVSTAVDTITVVNIAGPFKPDDEAPAYLLEPHNWYKTCPLLSPADAETGKSLGGMASGNYAGSSDSRWVNAVATITGNRFTDLVAVHDRFEGKTGGDR